LLAQLVGETTTAFDNYDNARVLERTETFFWSFCDNYVELVKIRAYGEENSPATRSARATLAITLSALQRMFAPFVPFVAEEVWRWWHTDSVHLTSWPSDSELSLGQTTIAPGSLYYPVCDVLEAIRRAKSTAKVSQRAEVSLCKVSGPIEMLNAVRSCQADLEKAGGVLSWQFDEASDLVIDVTLAKN
jgi:valyl-tRNA synthetase